MTQRKNNEGARRRNRLKDEVYRQMLFLEMNRPGAEMGLALALLRAWIAAGIESQTQSEWNWLRDACPAGLRMIEDSLSQGSTGAQLLFNICGTMPAK
jgi:hypothetical protein